MLNSKKSIESNLGDIEHLDDEMEGMMINEEKNDIVELDNDSSCNTDNIIYFNTKK